eukprot:2810108-Amphidinium_carterae.1
MSLPLPRSRRVSVRLAKCRPMLVKFQQLKSCGHKPVHELWSSLRACFATQALKVRRQLHPRRNE